MKRCRPFPKFNAVTGYNLDGKSEPPWMVLDGGVYRLTAPVMLVDCRVSAPICTDGHPLFLHSVVEDAGAEYNTRPVSTAR